MGRLVRTEMRSTVRAAIAAVIAAVFVLPMCSGRLLAATTFARYVDAADGNDANDGLTRPTAYKTISRALSDIPDTVGGQWTIHLRGGEYRESLQFDRFVMPGVLSFEQLSLEADTPARFIALRRDAQSTSEVILAQPAADSTCMTVTGAIVFVEGITFQTRGYNALMVIGGSVILDDVRFVAREKSRNAVYVDRSSLFFGGTLTIEGPFDTGVAIRNFSIARMGTRANAEKVIVSMRNVGTGFFLRDNATLTSAFQVGSVTIENATTGVYSILNATAFFPTTVSVAIKNSQVGVVAHHHSAINASPIQFHGVHTLARCSKQSYVLLELATYDTTEEIIEHGFDCFYSLAGYVGMGALKTEKVLPKPPEKPAKTRKR